MREEYGLDIIAARCKGCGICVEFCPAGALKLGASGKAERVEDKRCAGCMLCEMRCPDFAIIVRKQ